MIFFYFFFKAGRWSQQFILPWAAVVNCAVATPANKIGAGGISDEMKHESTLILLALAQMWTCEAQQNLA